MRAAAAAVPDAPHRSEPKLLVWLALRLRGLGEIETVAAVHRLDPDEVEWLLAELAADGLATFAEVNGVPKWLLTAQGRDEGEAALAAELCAAEARSHVEAAYGKLNRLAAKEHAVCRDWQVIDAPSVAQRRLNDHSDQRYDAAVLARLLEVNEQLTDLLSELAGVLARYGGYEARLTHAVSQLANGDVDYMVKPSIDSYHTVFFELQEDLIATLGLRRATEEVTPSF